jgi:hypothetical protein
VFTFLFSQCLFIWDGGDETLIPYSLMTPNSILTLCCVLGKVIPVTATSAKEKPVSQAAAPVPVILLLSTLLAKRLTNNKYFSIQKSGLFAGFDQFKQKETIDLKMKKDINDTLQSGKEDKAGKLASHEPLT